MKDQHKMIKGYSDLSEAEIKDMNTVKEMADRTGGLVERLFIVEDYDTRWIAIGRTDLQKGFMSLLRGIAKPGTF